MQKCFTTCERWSTAKITHDSFSNEKGSYTYPPSTLAMRRGWDSSIRFPP